MRSGRERRWEKPSEPGLELRGTGSAWGWGAEEAETAWSHADHEAVSVITNEGCRSGSRDDRELLLFPCPCAPAWYTCPSTRRNGSACGATRALSSRPHAPRVPAPGTALLPSSEIHSPNLTARPAVPVSRSHRRPPPDREGSERGWQRPALLRPVGRGGESARVPPAQEGARGGAAGQDTEGDGAAGRLAGRPRAAQASSQPHR